MRIISGIRKGHKLKTADGIHTRPTTDRVKESVFNLIQLSLPARSILDLFSGSGAMGIEAISRGTQHAVFVENNRQSFHILSENLHATGLAEYACLEYGDALQFLANTNETFDIIFLDPPYNQGYLKLSAEQISDRHLLNSDGIIVVETEVGGEVFAHSSFSMRKQAKYGKTLISVFEYSVNAGGSI